MILSKQLKKELLLFAFLYLLLFVGSIYGFYIVLDILPSPDFDPKRGYYLCMYALMSVCSLWGLVETWRALIFK